MKNLKKIFTIALVTVMAATMLVSCGGPKTSTEESAKIFLNVLLKDDKTNMDKIGIKEEDYTEFKKVEEDSIMKDIKNSGLDSSILTDQVKTDFKNNILKGLSTLSYEVTPVSTEKDTAKVDVKIKVFDMEKISKEAQDKTTEKAIANPNITEKEIYQEIFKLMGESIAAGTIKEESKTVTITLTKQDNVWLPGDDIGDVMATVMAG